MSNTVERTRIAVADAQPRLLQAGPRESREAVVFVHGNPGSADDWEALIGAAAGAGLRAVALDLPDFGETVAPEGFEHSVPGYAAFLGEALDVLGIERAHLVVHDFGGPIGLTWAAPSPRPRSTCCRPAATGPTPTLRRRSSGCWSTSSAA